MDLSGGSQEAPVLRWTAENLASSTPSRKNGVPEKEEQTGRFDASNYARNVVRALYNDHNAEENTRAQILACYYIQLFYMFRSLAAEDWKVVAVGASFLACKVVDMPRRMRGLLRAWNQHRVSNGEPELGEEEQRKMTERILKVEFLLLRILRFDFDVQLPIEFLEPLASKLLVCLSQHEAFKKQCGNRPATEVASNLKQEVLQTAERFTMDCFMGVAPLLAPPKVVAAGAVVLTTKYLRREMQMPELIKMMHSLDEGLASEDIKKVIEEIMNVFRTKSQAEKQKAANPPSAANLQQTAANPTPAANLQQQAANPPSAAAPSAKEQTSASAPATNAASDEKKTAAPIAAVAAPAAVPGDSGTGSHKQSLAGGGGGPCMPAAAPPTSSGIPSDSKPQEPREGPSTASQITKNRAARRPQPYASGSAC